MAPRRGFAAPRRTTAQIAEEHLTWLQSLPGDGPFLTVPVLCEKMSQGLEPTETEAAADFKYRYSEYRVATARDRDLTRDAFIRTVVMDVLGWNDFFDDSQATCERFAYSTKAFDVTTTPAFALWPMPASDAAETADQGSDTVLPELLGFVWTHDTVLTKRLDDGWSTTPIDRAASALRHHNVPLGLITNGRYWVLLWAPRGSATGWVLFDTHAMLDDRQQLDAFTTLASRRRFLAVAADETLPALLKAALASQEELTESLSVHVRQAVEMLVDAIGAADLDSGGTVLAGVDADELYEGAVTVVMRLVFLLAAEERRLLPGDDDFYIANYGIAGLADRLIDTGQAAGEDLLARQASAFPQILAATRLVHDGVRHPRLSIKGYGGSVFDPDRYPWLEGRQPGGPGVPPRVDDRTMLHIFTGLTRWQGRRLAYRTLDVEQIGYVYEGLLDHTAVRADTTFLGLTGKKEPEVSLVELEAQQKRGDTAFAKWLKDATGLTLAQIKKALAADISADQATVAVLEAACGNDAELAARITTFVGLLRTDERTGRHIVIPTGAWFVTSSSARSDAGSYYTPRSLAEEVVSHTLDALVYQPGPLQTLDEEQWRVVKPELILGLKVADIAMGSGAFLVAADRYLAERLLEALAAHGTDSVTDPALLDLAATVAEVSKRDSQQIDTDADEATVAARRLVATRCLYGVDINPMAVEMAKLSLWLATAAKDYPFGFLDHHLATGDSLLGLTDVKQLEYVHTRPDVGAGLHGQTLYNQTAHIRSALQRAIGQRRAIETMRVHDLRDIEQQQALLAAADRDLADLELLADAITAAAFAAAQDKNKSLNQRMLSVGSDGGRLLADTTPEPDKDQIRSDFRDSLTKLDEARPEGAFHRHPTQWVIRFPEVFMSAEKPGFDAVIGNPPYLGGKKISGSMGGDFRSYLVSDIAHGRTGNADLVVYFLLRATTLIRSRLGLLTTNTVGQGESREVGLDFLLENGSTIFRAVRSAKWPSMSASLEYSQVYLSVDPFIGEPSTLDGNAVHGISSALRIASRVPGKPMRLKACEGIAFQGSNINGIGFTLSEADAKVMIKADPQNTRVLFPYLNGKDLNSSPIQTPSRWIVNFGDMSSEEACTYKDPWLHVVNFVKPVRDLLPNYKARVRDAWWKFEHQARPLYSKAENLEEVTAITLVSSVMQQIRVSSAQVF